MKWIKAMWIKHVRGILAALAFFGVTGVTLIRCGEGIAQRGLLYVLAGPLAAQSRVDSIRTAHMIADTVAATVAPLRGHMDARFNRLEGYLIKVPQVRAATSAAERARIAAERDSLDRARLFPHITTP